jgi:1-acyl-sn-glycerol-3-phosphate acyltransferase
MEGRLFKFQLKPSPTPGFFTQFSQYHLKNYNVGVSIKETFVRLFFFFYRPILISIVVLNTMILGLVVILLSYLDRHGTISHYIGKFWSRMNLFLAGVSVSISGQEHIRKHQSYIIMSNHQSTLDIWALYGYLPLQFRWVMKIELRKYPIFGLGCERMGHIYIDRGDSEKAHESLKVAGWKIRNGASVLFPRGDQKQRRETLTFQEGRVRDCARGRGAHPANNHIGKPSPAS